MFTHKFSSALESLIVGGRSIEGGGHVRDKFPNSVLSEQYGEKVCSPTGCYQAHMVQKRVFRLLCTEDLGMMKLFDTPIHNDRRDRLGLRENVEEQEPGTVVGPPTTGSPVIRSKLVVENVFFSEFMSCAHISRFPRFEIKQYRNETC